MIFKKSVALILVLTFAFALPLSTWAQTGGGVELGDAADNIPPVPISDAALRTKEVGITVFGFTIPGVTLDGLVIAAAKIFIKAIIDDTIKWANTGFEGNPAYATNPGQYLGKIADNVAGKFIQGSDLGFLCSPFQAKIRLALQQQYVQPQQFQCSLTGVVGNIEGFYNNFAEGGWNGWLAMTQNDVNNPYGAYLTAKVELDSRIARAVGIQDKQLSWNAGFLSWSDCIEYDTDAQGQKTECLQRGPVVTPGKVIESQLENSLGSEIRQLELVNELDALVNALFTGLLRKTVNSVQGLFR